MSDWQWFEDFESRALARGDKERAQLRDIHRRAFACRETDPDQTLMLFEEGRQLAHMLGESWWVILFEQWRVHALLYYKRDYHNILDAAVSNVLTLRKPICSGFPQRLWAYTDLVNIYLLLDPLSNAEAIEETIAQAESELASGMDNTRYLLLETKVSFAIAQEQYDKALEIALGIRTSAQDDPDDWTSTHYLIGNSQQLCHIHHLRKDWSSIAGWAEEGEELARRRGHQQPIGTFLMWRATAAQREGRINEASRYYRSAISRVGRLKMSLAADWYDALCSYQALRGRLETALSLRDRQLTELKRRGEAQTEFETRLERLRLMIEMGLNIEEELRGAVASANNFRRPANYMRRLASVVGDKSIEIRAIWRGENLGGAP